MIASPFSIDASSLNFDESLLSGNATIDSEHRQLLAKAITLLNASTSGKHSREIQVLLDELAVDLANHFTHEDKIMADSGWAGARQHAEIHRLLMEEAHRLLEHHRANMVNFLDI